MILNVFQRTIVNATGDTLPAAVIDVYEAGTTTRPDLYEDIDGVTPLTNPFNADSNGFAQFYVASGLYDVEANLGGSSATWSDVELGPNAGEIDTALALKASLTGANFTGLVGFKKSADVASATVLPIPVNGNYADVTGTTTITSIATTGNIGTVLKYHFDGILILTHHATNLILPSGANITTSAGDEAEFIEYESGKYRCVNYTKADGTAISVVDSIDTSSTAQTKIGDLTIGESIAVTSWSYSGTTITINTTAVHNLIAGQYFRLTGLVATTNAPNGRWAVATVGDTDTITFTAVDTPTGTPTVSSATLDHGDITLHGSFAKFDLGRTYQDVSGSRVVNTIYTNPNDYPIDILASINSSATNVGFEVNGEQITKNDASNIIQSYSFEVPSKGEYKWNSATGTIQKWTELR